MCLLIDREHLQSCIQEMAQRILDDFSPARNHSDAPVVVISMKSGFMFAADLLQALDQPWPVVFAWPRQDDVPMVMESEPLIQGRHVIVVDTLMDTGGSQERLHSWLMQHQAASVRFAILLHKTVSPTALVPVCYLGFEVPDVRLVGYGLDEDHTGRGLAAVHTWWQHT
ncbi:MAG: hypoxanthine phosphoribosyltransferase [Magnetococcales bacterium]|nr:hypoxanthine phosphoribosyltransferase [Magnetococcales bacterium]